MGFAACRLCSALLTATFTLPSALGSVETFQAELAALKAAAELSFFLMIQKHDNFFSVCAALT